MLTQDQLALLAQSFYNHVLEREGAVRASGMYLTKDGRVARANYWGNVAEQVRDSLGGKVIPPFSTGLRGRIHAAIFSFCAGVMPPMPILGRSLL